MGTWALIAIFYFNTAMSVTTVEGFTSLTECQKAGNSIVNQNKESDLSSLAGKPSVEFNCVNRN